MKRVYLPLSLLTLVLIGLTPAFSAGSPDVAASKKKGTIPPDLRLTKVKAKQSQAKQSQKDLAVKIGRENHSEGENMPPALRRHFEKLMQSIPGRGGEGPAGSAAAWRFERRAYPEKDISLAKIEGARAAHAEHQAAAVKTFAAASLATPAPTWISLGPTQAVYPFSPFRTSGVYVPNRYLAGGRATALAISPVCVPGNCVLFATAAGGGVWRTKDALKSPPVWTYLSGSFGINAAGAIALDPNNSKVVWVGTGEANASSDSEAGVGLYKSEDGGDTWSGPIGRGFFVARSIGSIAIDPTDSNTMYVASTLGVRGVSSVEGGETASIIPGAPPWGLYKTTDGGVTWSFIFNGAPSTNGCRNTLNVVLNRTPCSVEGVRRVVLDPKNPNIVYAGVYAKGVWRSSDGGKTWQQIFLPIADAVATGFAERPEIAVTQLPNGNTRMYVGIGQIGAPPARFFRSDNVATGTPRFSSLSSAQPSSPGFATFNFCTGQCWYDNFVYTPAGNPDVVYVGGSYHYSETGRISNGRGVVLSTDAGRTFTDMTMDATDVIHPNGLHPDQHSLVTNPGNPMQFFESNDGGIMRSSGQFADISANCSNRGLSGAVLDRCQQLLSRVPTTLTGINQGMSTLQFYSLSVSPFDSTLLQGGTQDNGTWQSTSTPNLFRQTIFGDGGQSGFDVSNPRFRFHTFFVAQVDVNFADGATQDWNWIGDPIVGTGEEFYVPIISDPKVSGTMFVGTRTVFRTKTHGMGTMNLATFRFQCNEFTGHFQVQCGDWVPIGTTNLIDKTLGTRAGGAVAAVRRAESDTSTLWSATSTGRVFISKNADADPADSVTFTRLDTTASVAPNRFITGIAVDPANPNHAWISYSGYNASTPSTPGHVFEVTFNPQSLSATFVDRSLNLRDLPITDVAFDKVTGDLYTASDFGVYRLRSGGTAWALAAQGMPNVEVAGLTLVPNARLLYAASHGRGAWVLHLK